MRRFLEFIEKRLHPRYYVEAPVSFDVLDGDLASKIGGSHKAIMMDIGRKGCSFLVDRIMYRGFYLLGCLEDGGAHSIKLTFDTADSDEAPELTGRIVWIDNVSGSGDRRFKIGVELHPALEGREFNRLLRLLSKSAMQDKQDKGEQIASM